MKGRSVTSDQKRFHDALANSIGCIACAKDGTFNNYVSIHHIAGRTNPIAHWLVLPLCGPHHQDSGNPLAIAIHPWKARFERKYGTQLSLLCECLEILYERGGYVPDGALNAVGLRIPHQKQNPATVDAVPGGAQ